MGVKLKDIFNKKVNSKNKQVSFDLKKKKAKEHDISIEDIMNVELNNHNKHFKEW